MKYAISVPNFGDYVDPRLTADLARQTEAAGWDGFYVWDHINAAYAPGTDRVRIGAMVTPLARRRPWKLARETATIDQLSDGRLILGVGLGYPAELEFAVLGEEPDDRIRAEKLDEGLEVLTGLWSGEPSGATELAQSFESAGATWLQVGAWSLPELRDQIAAGPAQH